MMPRWRVIFIGRTLGTLDAPDEKSAVAEATRQFHITPARRHMIVVTKIETKRE